VYLLWNGWHIVVIAACAAAASGHQIAVGMLLLLLCLVQAQGIVVEVSALPGTGIELWRRSSGWSTAHKIRPIIFLWSRWFPLVAVHIVIVVSD